MKNDDKMTTHWKRRDAKQQAKKRFSSDNRRSVRWLYLNAGQKTEVKEKTNG